MSTPVDAVTRTAKTVEAKQAIHTGHDE